MRVDNSLTREYLLNYPADAARILDQVSAEHVAALLSELPVKTSAGVMTCMLPDKAMVCLQVMAAALAAKLMAELPVPYVARVYRLMSVQRRDEIFVYLSERNRKHILRFLKYPSASAGILLNPVVAMLPAEVTVAGAIRAIERSKHSVGCDIYVIDEAHHLMGVVDIGKLLKSNNHLRLRDIMNRKTHRISAFAKAETLLTHPGWTLRHSLPVVDRDNTLVGTLEYSKLQAEFASVEEESSPDSLGGLLSFAGLYWLTVAQLIDSVFGIAATSKGESS